MLASKFPLGWIFDRRNVGEWNLKVVSNMTISAVFVVPFAKIVLYYSNRWYLDSIDRSRRRLEYSVPHTLGVPVGLVQYWHQIRN
jgi:hypothetical protein